MLATHMPLLTTSQEGWIAKHAVADEDRQATQQAKDPADASPADPMQGLQGLDEAGPRQA